MGEYWGGGGEGTLSLVYFIMVFQETNLFRNTSHKACVLEELIHCSFQFLYPGCKAFSYNFKGIL